MFGALGQGPEVPETPVDITQTTFGVPPPVDMTPSPAPIMTTAQVNGDPNIGGSIDGGGPVDSICAWWVGPQSRHYGDMVDLQDTNQMSSDQYGLPLYVPSVVGRVGQVGLLALGALYGGYHGWIRSGGRWGPTLGYGVLTAYVPLVGLAVSLFQGPFQKRRG